MKSGEHPCPYCGVSNDVHENLTGKGGPSPGDASLCAYCARFGIFEQGTEAGTLSIRKPNEQEQAELDADTDVQFVRMAVLSRLTEKGYES